MSRVKTLLIAIILVVGILSPTTGLASPGVTVSISDVTLATGATGSVALTISGVTDERPVSCITVDVNYKPSVVKVLDVSGGDFSSLVDNIQNPDGYTRLVAFVTSEIGLTGTIKVADISLKCLGGESELALDVITLKDDDGESIPFTVVNGWVIAERIGISQPLPEETPPEETPPQETAPEETAPAEQAPTEQGPAEQAPTEQGPAEQAPSSPSRTSGWPMVAWAGIAAGAAIVITLIVVLARRRRY